VDPEFQQTFALPPGGRTLLLTVFHGPAAPAACLSFNKPLCQFEVRARAHTGAARPAEQSFHSTTSDPFLGFFLWCLPIVPVWFPPDRHHRPPGRRFHAAPISLRPPGGPAANVHELPRNRPLRMQLKAVDAPGAGLVVVCLAINCGLARPGPSPRGHQPGSPPPTSKWISPRRRPVDSSSASVFA